MAVLGLAGWLEIIKGVLAFPDKILAVVRLFQKTPAEKHYDLLKAAQDEAAKWDSTGRPTW